MFQKPQRGQGRKILGNHPHKQHQKPACTAFRQGPASRVISINTPSLQRRNDRLGKLPVGGNQCCSLLWLFQHFAHGKCDYIRLCGAIWGFEHRQPGQRVTAQIRVGAAKLPPVSGQSCRFEGLAHQCAPHRGLRALADRMRPRQHIARHHIKAVQKHRKLVLRVSGIIANMLPVIAGGIVQPRQHHMAVWQVNNTPNQFAR